MQTTVIVLCLGNGTRMGLVAINKMALECAGVAHRFRRAWRMR